MTYKIRNTLDTQRQRWWVETRHFRRFIRTDRRLVWNNWFCPSPGLNRRPGIKRLEAESQCRLLILSLQVSLKSKVYYHLKKKKIILHYRVGSLYFSSLLTERGRGRERGPIPWVGNTWRRKTPTTKNLKNLNHQRNQYKVTDHRHIYSTPSTSSFTYESRVSGWEVPTKSSTDKEREGTSNPYPNSGRHRVGDSRTECGFVNWMTFYVDRGNFTSILKIGFVLSLISIGLLCTRNYNFVIFTNLEDDNKINYKENLYLLI